jgi:hypothetical protein
VHSKKDLIFRYSASVKLTDENELEAASKDPVGAFGHFYRPFVIGIFMQSFVIESFFIVSHKPMMSRNLVNIVYYAAPLSSVFSM